jgi:hypothetical protein
MRIEKVLDENEYAIYTVELEPGFYVDVKAFRTGSKLIYVMQNEDGTVVYGGEERTVAPTCFYSEGVEKTIIDLVAMNEREVAASAPGTECPFCRKLEDMMDREKEWKASPRYKPGYSEEYTVACVNTTYYEGNVTGRLTSGGYALNFCPVCGKDLSVSEKLPAAIEDEGTNTECIPSTPTDIDDLKKIYDSLAEKQDPHGFWLFRAAQNILGKFECSHFAYEDNTGRFEEADGHTLLAYLLVQYDYKLGQTNAHRNRWAQVYPCYEKCIDLTIDKSTPEYAMFEMELYREVLDLLCADY